MSQKAHPKIMRIGVIYGWDSKWYAQKREYPKLLQEDIAIRVFLAKKLKEASVDRAIIERTQRAMTITIHSARPGVIIGRGGAGIEELKNDIRKLLRKGKKDKFNLNLNVIEVTNPSLSAHIVLQAVIADLEKRMPFRRTLKQNMERVQKAGGKGVKIMVAGRLNGAEIAREEKVSWGSVPLQNLRADIDYAGDFAWTTYGTIGVKVWIYRGDLFNESSEAPRAVARPVARPMGGPARRFGGPRPAGNRPPLRSAPAGAPRSAAPAKSA